MSTSNHSNASNSQAWHLMLTLAHSAAVDPFRSARWLVSGRPRAWSWFLVILWFQRCRNRRVSVTPILLDLIPTGLASPQVPPESGVSRDSVVCLPCVKSPFFKCAAAQNEQSTGRKSGETEIWGEGIRRSKSTDHWNSSFPWSQPGSLYYIVYHSSIESFQNTR